LLENATPNTQAMMIGNNTAQNNIAGSRKKVLKLTRIS
jgi:hypothetical protein